MVLSRIVRTLRAAGAAGLAALALAAPAAAQERTRAATAGRGWIGIAFEARRAGGARGESPAIVITRVEPGSPAARAGLDPGDTLVSIDGRRVTAATLYALPARLAPGDTVTLEVRRGDARTVRVVAAPRPVRYAFVPGPPVIFYDSLRRTVRVLLDSARAAARVSTLDRRFFDSTLTAFRHEREQAYRAAAAALERARSARALERMRQQSEAAEPVRAMEQLQRLEQLEWIRERTEAAARAAQDFERMRRDAETAARRLRALERPRAWLDTARDPLPRSGPWIVRWLELGERAVAGAELVELNPELAGYFEGADAGVLVVRVGPGTPAARAGLRPGDVVTAADGRAVRAIRELRRAVAEGRRDVRLEVVRKGRRLELRLDRDL